MDFATRAYNHSFPFDPIVRSALDTDFYKLLMQQFIWEHYPNQRVGWKLTNRTSSIRLGADIDRQALREQLDHARSLSLTASEVIHLRGQSFYGQSGIFKEGYLHTIKSFQLPDYELSADDDGQLVLRFEGLWWQEHCMLTAREVLGERFTGTSNVFLAMKHGLEAKGTNAHELPMVLAAIARSPHPGDDEALRQSQYDVLRKWQTEYRGNLLVFLPDTFGTTQFLARAPQWLSGWTGARPDSKNPFEAGEELIAFWRRMAITADAIAASKLVIFSDGLDVRIPGYQPNGVDIPELLARFAGRVKVGFGWGTNLTNDFIDCHPIDSEALRAPSLVCKVNAVNGHAAVKLSDNPAKAIGPPEEIAAYKAALGMAGRADIGVKV